MARDRLLPVGVLVRSATHTAGGELSGRAEREAALGDADSLLARLHNAKEISQAVDATLQRFHDRPYRVLNSYRFVEATRAALRDPLIRALPLSGCISPCVDITDILATAAAARRFATAVGSRRPASATRDRVPHAD